MKILFLHFPLIPPSGGGGAETELLSLACGLRDHGHRIFLLSSDDWLVNKFKDSNFAAKQIWLGWEPTSIKALLLFPITLIISKLFFLWQLVRKKPDITFCSSMTDKLIFTTLALIFGVRVIWLEHTRIGRWLYKNPLLFWYQFLAHRVKIVAPSFFLRNQLIQAGVKIDNIKIIYPGVKASLHSVEKNHSNKFTIGFLGRLSAEKGVEILLRALKKYLEDYAPAFPPLAIRPRAHGREEGEGEGGVKKTKCLIAGEGPDKKQLEKVTAELNLKNRVEFLGTITNKSDFFREIDILVVPSVQAESFGLVIVEAMAADVPVIASRIGAIPEIIEHEKTGLLFGPGNVSELVSSLNFAQKNPERIGKMTEKARQMAALRFSESRMIEEFLPLIIPWAYQKGRAIIFHGREKQ